MINSVIYLILALQKGFYGEVLTTLYFTVICSQGDFYWGFIAQFKKEKQEFVARKLDGKGSGQSIFPLVCFGGAFVFIYQSIGATIVYRDSITQTTNGVVGILI